MSFMNRLEQIDRPVFFFFLFLLFQNCNFRVTSPMSKIEEKSYSTISEKVFGLGWRYFKFRLVLRYSKTA